jgi:hypothetical protein
MKRFLVYAAVFALGVNLALLAFLIWQLIRG